MAIKAVKGRTRTRTHGIIFTYKSGMLFITLPSGRDLVYVKPKLMLNKFGREGLTYEGIGTTKKWERIETYGPKIVENIVQAASRDLLAEAMLRLDKEGFSIVAHVHDEVICEVPVGESSVEEICKIMSVNPKWAKGLPLDADGFACDFYQKN
jgi:DNA polymerase